MGDHGDANDLACGGQLPLGGFSGAAVERVRGGGCRRRDLWSSCVSLQINGLRLNGLGLNGLRLGGLRLNGLRLNGDDGTSDYIEITKVDAKGKDKVVEAVGR